MNASHSKIAMRSMRGANVIAGPWHAPLRKRVNWTVVGAIGFGALWIFIFGVTVGVLLS